MATNFEMLREIQDLAVRSDSSISELLRRCQVFAARVGLAELEDWVRHELNGYPPEVDLPEYRVFSGIAKGHLLGPFGSGLRNAVLPAGNLPEEYRDWGRKAFLRQPIAALEDVAKETDGNVTIPWPGDLIARVQTRFYEGMSLGQAWLEIGRSDFLSAVETVRNRILSFALDAERHVEPESEGAVSQGSQALAHSFHTHIYGSVANLAQGSTDFVQYSGISSGDLTGLLAELRRVGVPEEDIGSLQQAISEDGAQPKGRIGRRVADWVGRMVGKAMSGGWTVATNTASTVLPKLIERYYS